MSSASRLCRTYGPKVVINATHPLTFKVTRRDLNRCAKWTGVAAVLVMALMSDKTVLSAKIGKSVALIERETCYERYSISKELQRKIDAFNKAIYFEPGDWTFLPPAAASLGDSTTVDGLDLN